MNIEYLISKYGDIPLSVYGYQDGMFFFIGSSCDGVSLNLGIRFDLAYEDAQPLISRDKPIRLIYGVYDILEVFMHGKKVKTFFREKHRIS